MNLKARGLRSHNTIVDWLSHWLHAAGIRHRGGYKGRPGSCKGLFSDACSRVVVERKKDATTGRWAESEEAFEARRARLLMADKETGGVIPGVLIRVPVVVVTLLRCGRSVEPLSSTGLGVRLGPAPVAAFWSYSNSRFQ